MTATVKEGETKKLSEEITFSQPVFSSSIGKEYIIPTMEQTTGFLMETGKPMLPVFSKTFTFPWGTTIADVKCTPESVRTTQLSQDIQPAPEPVTVGMIKATNTNGIKKKASVYNTTINYPNTWFDVRTGAGIHNGERVVFLTIDFYPMQYNPSKNMVTYAQTADLMIQKKEQHNAQLVTNDEYSLLVLTPASFFDELQDLKNHKENNRGLSTKIVTIDQVYSGSYFTVEGDDNQEKIKYFIKNAVEQWGTSYVLLVGGEDYFPVRLTHVELNNDNEVFSSDLYYADIYNETGSFSSWDTNNNGVYGEYNWEGNTDEVDLYPDVYLGRLACVDENEVTTAVDKIIAYETGEAYTQDWFTKIVVGGGDSFTDAYGEDSGVREGEVVNKEVLQVMDGFIPVKLWESNGEVYRLNNFDDAMNEGAGFVELSGHGNPRVWATHAHNGSKNLWLPTSSGVPGPAGGFRLSDINALSNSDKLPIVVTGACSTSKFTSLDECFGWSFISHSDGGAIATLGCTGLGYVYIGEYITQGLVGKMEVESFKSYKYDEAKTFGELWSNTIKGYITGQINGGDYKTIEEWQPFGDPSLAIASASQPPETPARPDGPTSGKIGTEYTYSATTTEPEGEQIYYLFDWGDDTFSSWLGPYSSGETVQAAHTWQQKGDYSIRVKAKDEHGVQSEWSGPLPISMPKSKNTRQYDHLFKLLQRLFPQKDFSGFLSYLE